MRVKLTIAAITTAAVLSGCTSIKVEPVSNEYSIKHICIQNNPRVIIDGFINTVEDRFQYHGISTEILDLVPETCEYKLTYTALRSWDLAPYLSHAELRLFKDNRRIAYGEFHLNGKGGFALTKFNSIKTKMDPVVDEMLGKAPTN